MPDCMYVCMYVCMHALCTCIYIYIYMTSPEMGSEFTPLGFRGQSFQFPKPQSLNSKLSPSQGSHWDFAVKCGKFYKVGTWIEHDRGTLVFCCLLYADFAGSGFGIWLFVGSCFVLRLCL